MSVRFYISPMVQHPAVPNRWVSKAALYGDENTSTRWKTPYPYLNWSLIAVDAPEAVHTNIQSDVDIQLVPFIDDQGNYLPLSATVSQVAVNHRNNISTYLNNRRIPTDWVNGGMTLGFVLKSIWQYLEVVEKLTTDYPNLDLTNTVQQIPAQQRQRVLGWLNANGIQTNDITLQWTINQLLRRVVRDYTFPATIDFGFALL